MPGSKETLLCRGNRSAPGPCGHLVCHIDYWFSHVSASHKKNIWLQNNDSIRSNMVHTRPGSGRKEQKKKPPREWNEIYHTKYPSVYHTVVGVAWCRLLQFRSPHVTKRRNNDSQSLGLTLFCLCAHAPPPRITEYLRNVSFK